MSPKTLILLIAIIALVGAASASTYTSHYPPAQTGTYVKVTNVYDVTYQPYYATNPALSLTGASASNSWLSDSSHLTNMRFNIDLGSAYQIARLYYENFHDTGTVVDDGVQHFTLWGSNSSSAFQNTTYTNDTGWTSISVDVALLNPHITQDIADPKYVMVTKVGTWSYEFYSLKCADNNGGTDGMGFRRMEFQTLDGGGGGSYPDPYTGQIAASLQGVAPYSVDFSDYSVSNVSNPSIWNWTLQNISGDNIERSFSTIQAPTYVFNYPGTYSIRLNASSTTEWNKTPANQVFVNVTSVGNNPPTPAFTASPLNPSYDHQAVTFTDQSLGSPNNWTWTINNGIYYLTYFSQNPVITDMIQGSWTVSLTVRNTYGSNTLTKNNYIIMGAVTPTPTPPTPTPTATPTPVPTPAPGPYMPSVLLLHLNSASWVDESPAPHALTAGGSPTLNTTVKKFGAGSIRFNNNQYLRVTTSSQADFQIGTGDFTVDLWYYDTTGSSINKYQALYDQAYSADHPPLVIVQEPLDTTLTAFFSISPGTISTWVMTMGDAPKNAWTHIALVRKGNNYYAFNNGNLISTVTRSDSLANSAANPSIGGRSTYDQFLTGIIDEVKFSRTAKWTSNFTPPMSESQDTWNYTVPGTYTWICPDGITAVSMREAAAGGTGASGSRIGQYMGNGGSAGQVGSYSNIPVNAGQSYTIIVGQASAGLQNDTMAVGSYAPSGGLTQAFSRTVLGGLGGNQVQALSSTSGNDGQSTNFLTLARLAQAGALLSGGNGQYGGKGGQGWGAGGGGGGFITYGGPTDATSSGAGANGTVLISIPGAFGENTPDFAADVVAGQPGQLVHFTDLSVIRDPTVVGYIWDFGDGSPQSYSSSNVTHTYTQSGTFTVSLTLTGSSTSMTETKNGYITIGSSSSGITTLLAPHTVSIAFIDKQGNGISGLNVAATPINFSAPAAWIQQYYGISSGVKLNGTTLTGISDSGGNWVAPMLGSYEYNLTMYGANVTAFSLLLFPVGDSYQIRVPKNGEYVQPLINFVSYSAANATINSTAEWFNMSYQDTSGGTPRVQFTVTNSTGGIVYNSTIGSPGTGVNMINTTLTHAAGDTYTYRISAPQAQVGYVNQTYTVTWQGLATMSNYPSWVGQWLGIAALVLCAGSVSLISVKYAVVILPVFTFFLMFYTRWLNPVVGVTAMIACLGILLTLGMLKYIRDSKGKLGRT